MYTLIMRHPTNRSTFSRRSFRNTLGVLGRLMPKTMSLFKATLIFRCIYKSGRRPPGFCSLTVCSISSAPPPREVGGLAPPQSTFSPFTSSSDTLGPTDVPTFNDAYGFRRYSCRRHVLSFKLQLRFPSSKHQDLHWHWHLHRRRYYSIPCRSTMI